MSDFEELQSQYQQEILKAYGIPMEYLDKDFNMTTIGGVKKIFKKAGIKRYKLIIHDHLNVTIKVPRKHIKNVKELSEKTGLVGINYQMKKLWFFQCWFKRIQVIEENKF